MRFASVVNISEKFKAIQMLLQTNNNRVYYYYLLKFLKIIWHIIITSSMYILLTQASRKHMAISFVQVQQAVCLLAFKQ